MAMDDVRLSAIEKQLEKIFNLLDGPSGVITKVELQGQQLRDIPSPANLKWYAFIGGGIITFFGLIGWSVVRIFRDGG